MVVENVRPAGAAPARGLGVARCLFPSGQPTSGLTATDESRLGSSWGIACDSAACVIVDVTAADRKNLCPRIGGSWKLEVLK